MNFLEQKEIETEFVPYYKGFKGTIKKESEKRFITQGVFTMKKNILDITELPIGTWNEDYIIFLDKLVDDGIIKDMNDMSTKTDVNFKITLSKEIAEEEIIKIFKLSSYLSITNMNLFNHEEKLTHYDSINDICDDFIIRRLGFYEKRRNYLIQLLTDELEILKNKYTYILEVLAETIELRRKTGEQINTLLQSKKYRLVDDSYNYLTKMTMDSVSIENVDKLKKQYDDKNKELIDIQNTTDAQMWYNELKELYKMM
jgi:DNA topoisomerase-2